MNTTFTHIALDERCHVLIGTIDQPELGSEEMFAALWQLRPTERQQVVIAKRRVAIPRRQQAFGQNYAFSGNVAEARPTPPLLTRYLAWSHRVEPQLNGLLVNWYDAALEERIGRHRDETRD